MRVLTLNQMVTCILNTAKLFCVPRYSRIYVICISCATFLSSYRTRDVTHSSGTGTYCCCPQQWNRNILLLSTSVQQRHLAVPHSCATGISCCCPHLCNRIILLFYTAVQQEHLAVVHSCATGTSCCCSHLCNRNILLLFTSVQQEHLAVLQCHLTAVNYWQFCSRYA